MDIAIPAGAYEGYKLEYAGAGNQKLHHRDGDLVFVVRHAPHPTMAANDGDPADLIVQATVPLVDALVGFQRRIRYVLSTMTRRCMIVLAAYADVVCFPRL